MGHHITQDHSVYCLKYILHAHFLFRGMKSLFLWETAASEIFLYMPAMTRSFL